MRLAIACGALLLGACTEPGRSQVSVVIDADLAVRSLIDQVEATVEVQAEQGGGWQDARSRRFFPNTENKWPIDYAVDVQGTDAKARHQLTATARGKNGVVLAQARAVRKFGGGYVLPLRVLFESSCFGRAELVCGGGQTCHDGACVDSAYDGAALKPSDEGVPDAGTGMTDPNEGVVIEGDACDADGLRGCAPAPLQAPLVCDGGMWRTSFPCREDEQCDGGSGMCRSIARECMGRAIDVEFCDSGKMLVCDSKFVARTLACGENEHCVSPGQGAKCECSFGFVKENAGAVCREARDCSVNRGGCDPMTTCSMASGGRVCSACPSGFVGDGETGCQPLLTGIDPSDGELIPAFDPDVTEYRVKVPLVVQRLTLTPRAGGSARIALNGNELPASGTWTTPTLPLGEFPVELSLTTNMSGNRSYKLIVERAGAQTTYIKPKNPDLADAFGASLAIEGDTLVASAMYEDSAATGVNGDAADDSATDAGAVYVFVRRGGTWEQQAYLKPSDTQRNDFFGSCVSISGDRIAVGSVRRNLLNPIDNPTRPGSVYVFTRTAGTWRETKRVLPKSSSGGDMFGFGVVIRNDTLVVGAAGDGGSGAAYLFTRDGDDWIEQLKLKPKVPVAGSYFGSAVAIAGDTLVVTAQDDSTEAAKAGSATLFTLRDGAVVGEQRIVPNPASVDASFGFALAASDDVIMVGAPRTKSILWGDDTTPGEVFVYERSGGTWMQTQVLKGMPSRTRDAFGSSVALHARGALIGATGDNSDDRGIGADASRRSAEYAGAAYLYARDAEGWKQSAYLKAQNADANDMFGIGAAISDDIAVVSAFFEGSNANAINGNADNNSLPTSGALYIFE